MTIQLIEGFDLVGSSTDLLARGASYSEGVVTASAGRFGGNGYKISTGTANILSFQFTFANYVTVSFWYKIETISASVISCIADVSVSSYQNVNCHTGLQLAADGSIAVGGDGNIPIASSPAGLIQPNTWHHIEYQVHLNASGTGILTVDGVEVVNVSGDFLESTQANVFQLVGDSTHQWFDDVVYRDDASTYPALLGEHKIHTLLPSGDTAQADWAGGYTDIDDPLYATNDGDTTYISATTLNDKSEFGLGGLSESPSEVHAVQVTTDARKTDAGTKALTSYLDSSGGRGDGTEFSVSETYSSRTDIHETDPNGSIPWTTSAVNAVEVGVEITT